MTNETDRPDQHDAEHAAPDPEREEASATSGSGPRVARGTGHSLGATEGLPGVAGRVADFAQRIRDAAEAARAAAEEHRPTAEAAARVARDRAEQAMRAARPRVERAAQDVTTYAREHDAQLRAAMARAGRIAASMAIPPSLRPMADAINEELHREPPHAAEAGTPGATDETPPPAKSTEPEPTP